MTHSTENTVTVQQRTAMGFGHISATKVWSLEFVTDGSVFCYYPTKAKALKDARKYGLKIV